MIKGWKATTIRDAAQFTSKPRYIDLKIAEKVPFVPMDLVPQDRSFIQDCVWKPGRDIRSGTYFERGDCLLAKITPCFENGKQGIAKDLPASFGYASTELIPFRGRAGLSNKYFLFFFFLDTTTRRLIAQKMEGATGRQRIPISVLKDWPISLPPLPEQKKIAAVLLKLQQAIETQDKIIQSLRDLKASTMQHLFTHGLHGEKTKQTEIGPIPESWEVTKLGKVATISAGGTPSRSNTQYWQNGNIPWVKTGEVDYCWITKTEEYVTTAGLQNSAAKLLPIGTILLAMYGQGITRGKVARLGIEAATNQACATISPKAESIQSAFLYHYLTWSYDRLRLLSHGAQQANLNAKIVSSFPVPVPIASEQDDISTAFDTIDTKSTMYQSRKSALQDLFKTTLNKLMTGEIRVADLDIDTKEVEE